MLPEGPLQGGSRTRERLAVRPIAKRSRIRLLISLGVLIVSGSAEDPATDKPDIALPPLSVRGIHIAPNLPSARMKLDMQLALELDFGWPRTSPDFLITPARVPQSPRTVAWISPPADELVSRMRVVFRDAPLRSRGLTALVLRDGLPIANPFDGSVPWRELPEEGLRRTESITAGGATAWGAGTGGGSVQLFTREPLGKIVTEPGNGKGQAIDGGPLIRRVVPTGLITGLLGGLGTGGAELIVSAPTARGILQILGGFNSADGAPVISANQRGPVDEAAWHRGRWLETRWRQPAGQDTELLASIRTFQNSRGFGAPGQFEEAEGTAISITMAGSHAGAWAWNGSVYGQTFDTNGALSSITRGRASEVPILHLASRPASRYGASWAMYLWHRDMSRTIFGTDLRLIRGEVREEFAFENGGFTRELIAGGTDTMLGVFGLHERSIGPAVRTTFGARLETWDQHAGYARDLDRRTGLTLHKKDFDRDGGTRLIPSAGIVWALTRAWRLKANAQSTFRPPTLAERFQTWGEPGTITFANPNLSPEANTSFEVTLEYTNLPKPVRGFSVTAFHNRLHDLIARRAIPSNSDEFPGIVALPVGLSGRQSFNLERAEVQGLVLYGRWQVWHSLSLSGRLEINDSTILKAPGAEPLVGRRLPHVGYRTGSVTAHWQPREKWTGGLTVRALGRRFADEENTLRLRDAVLVDATLSYRVSTQVTVSVRLENAMNERAETSRDSQGVVYVGMPRELTGGIRFAW